MTDPNGAKVNSIPDYSSIYFVGNKKTYIKLTFKKNYN